MKSLGKVYHRFHGETTAAWATERRTRRCGVNGVIYGQCAPGLVKYEIQGRIMRPEDDAGRRNAARAAGKECFYDKRRDLQKNTGIFAAASDMGRPGGRALSCADRPRIRDRGQDQGQRPHRAADRSGDRDHRDGDHPPVRRLSLQGGADRDDDPRDHGGRAARRRDSRGKARRARTLRHGRGLLCFGQCDKSRVQSDRKRTHESRADDRRRHRRSGGQHAQLHPADHSEISL